MLSGYIDCTQDALSKLIENNNLSLLGYDNDAKNAIGLYIQDVATSNNVSIDDFYNDGISTYSNVIDEIPSTLSSLSSVNSSNISDIMASNNQTGNLLKHFVNEKALSNNMSVETYLFTNDVSKDISLLTDSLGIIGSLKSSGIIKNLLR